MMINAMDRDSSHQVVVQENNRSIADLPQELIYQILGLLPPKDFAQATQVCKAWSNFSQDELLWRQICQNEEIRPASIKEKKEWRKRCGEEIEEPVQSWRAIALAQASLNFAFKKGGALGRLPTKREADSKIHLGRLKFYPFVPSEMARPQNHIWWESNVVYIADECGDLIVDLEHPLPVSHSNIFDGFLVSKDEIKDVRIWDLNTCTPVFQYSKLEGTNFYLKDNILFATGYKKKEKITIIKVKYLDQSNSDFSFSVPGNVTCMALQGEILALNTSEQIRENVDPCSPEYQTIHAPCFLEYKATMRLIDLEKKCVSSYEDPIPCIGRGFKTALSWVGFSLYLFKKLPHTDDFATLEEWDFSPEGSSPNPKRPMPLLIQES